MRQIILKKMGSDALLVKVGKMRQSIADLISSLYFFVKLNTGASNDVGNMANAARVFN
jgi:hypothetical protein